MSSWKTLFGHAESKTATPPPTSGVNGATAAQSSSPAPRVQLRAEPKELSKAEAREMSRTKDFCVQGWNTYGAFENDVQDNKDGTVTERVTGLVWQQGGTPEEMNLKDAERYIAGLNQKRFAGHNDWRLPTLEEGLSLLRGFMNTDGLYISRYFDARQKWIWTSDHIAHPVEAWDVNFLDGHAYCEHPDNVYYVRACRTAQ